MFETLLQALEHEPADAPLHYRVFGEDKTGVELPEFPTVARLTADGSAFRACVLMKSRRPATSATQDNQRTWELGDAAELFLQLPGHEDYWEFHSTPAGVRLQLHLPSMRPETRLPLTNCMCDVGLQLVNRILPERQLWYTELRIPFAAIGATGPECRYFLGRYNHSDFPGKEPEISCWPFIRGTFHNPSGWNELR